MFAPTAAAARTTIVRCLRNEAGRFAARAIPAASAVASRGAMQPSFRGNLFSGAAGPSRSRGELELECLGDPDPQMALGHLLINASRYTCDLSTANLWDSTEITVHALQNMQPPRLPLLRQQTLQNWRHSAT